MARAGILRSAFAAQLILPGGSGGIKRSTFTTENLQEHPFVLGVRIPIEMLDGMLGSPERPRQTVAEHTTFNTHGVDRTW